LHACRNRNANELGRIFLMETSMQDCANVVYIHFSGTAASPTALSVVYKLT
jgi:hypothetical protein